MSRLSEESHPLVRNLCNPQDGQQFSVAGKKYQLQGKIGDGAVGIVRKATDLSHSQTLAVKFLAPDPKYIEMDVFEDVQARFRREGERGAKLDHPHLLKILAYVHNDDGECFEKRVPKNPFILMEYITGRNLEAFIKKERERSKTQAFSVTKERLSCAIQVVHALLHLHQKKVVHRDVKPANIFFEKEGLNRKNPRVKVGDFGIMKWGDFHSQITTGTLTMTHHKGLGTLKYMAPEQALRPKDVTVKSDIFPLGITLFELFTSDILPSSHHVYEIVNARLGRGTTLSRMHDLGYDISGESEGLAELVLDMFRRGVDGRPTTDKILRRFEYEYERNFGDWRRDLG